MGLAMKYDGLQQSYWQQRDQKIKEILQHIQARPQLGNGRVLPDDQDLSIGDGRRLPMAIMFLDICGFSKRAMGNLQEQDLILRVLNLFFSEMIRIAQDYGGTIEKHTGDGLMIYFEDNSGNPPEKGTVRAIACALTMQAVNLYFISPILQNSGVNPIEFRVSLDYGFVTIARLGLPKTFNASVAIGNAANFACKSLRFAQPGDILLGELAKEQLPLPWQLQYTQRMWDPTGWVYQDQRPYPLYKYTGRWSQLI